MNEAAHVDAGQPKPGHAGLPLAQQIVGLIVWFALVFAAAAIGAAASIQAGEFYRQLNRPPWAPPAWLFGPVWTILYALMALAAWLVWRPGGFYPARTALWLFLAQLALNALWSWLFFAWSLGSASVIEIALLWLLILLTTAAFWRHQRLAAILLLPYLAWVTFAAVLNATLWLANPQILR